MKDSTDSGGWRNWLGTILPGAGLIMRPLLLLSLVLVHLVLMPMVLMPIASGQDLGAEAVGKNLSLNVRLQETGQALVMGYVDDPRALMFLRPSYYSIDGGRSLSRYRFDNDTRQLYAWTDALTFKQGDIWRLYLSCPGTYGDYRVVFHLPGSLRLGRINSSRGLNYMISASNESLQVDAQGRLVKDPTISIEYQQPLGHRQAEDSTIWDMAGQRARELLFPATMAIAVLGTGSALALITIRRRELWPPILAIEADPPASPPPQKTASVAPSQPAKTEEPPDRISVQADPAADSNLVESEEPAPGRDLPPLEGVRREPIELDARMMAVMETLTPRERAILDILIKHGGRMTQMEIRYETGSPKSSLAMILISLERRKLITKRVRGRTNVIELSDLFSSPK